MSFKGKVVERKEINSPIGKVVLITKEFKPFPKRRKVIFWLGELQVVKLGELITTYRTDPKRKSAFEPMKYVPLYYTVKVNESADVSEIAPFYVLDEELEESLEDGFKFDEKEEAITFIQGLRCKSVKQGGVCVDSKADFERWKRVMEKVNKD